MTGSELYDLFVEPGVTTSEIAQMDLDTMTRHIGELRQSEPDDLAMSDDAIAAAVLEYARSN